MSFQQSWTSTIGRLTIKASSVGLTQLIYAAEEPIIDHPSSLTHDARSQIDDYLSGTRKAFDLPIDVQGTAFQQSVWREVADIKFGTTCSYLDIARALNNTGAIRAVGAANGANPLPIIIPCHRVIGTDGRLTGYRYGLDVKRKLLALENPSRWGYTQGELW